MTGILMVAVVALGIAVMRLSRRIVALEARISAPAIQTAPEPLASQLAYHEGVASAVPLRDRIRVVLPRFEDVIGKRLPIWIGGFALVVSGIFFVRLSIEAGWLGPAVRTLIAAITALLFLIGSEASRRMALFQNDVRIGQVMAGTGIASSYATLYLAVAQYHLIGPVTGFALLAAITALGLFLAIRHGPPTAVMTLFGGFSAPLIAGYDFAGIGALLMYLGVFLSSVLALSAVRGWVWLTASALVGAFGWTGLLTVYSSGTDLAVVGWFIVAVAIVGTVAVPSAGAVRPLLRVAPILAALVQLLVLAPRMNVDGLAWSFYLTLSAATLFLASKNRLLLPGAIALSAAITVFVAIGLSVEREPAVIAAPIAMLLFGVIGAIHSRKDNGWSTIALLGFLGPLIVMQVEAGELAPDAVWFVLDLVVAGLAAAMAWQHRDRSGMNDIGLIGSIAACALLAAIGLAWIIPASAIALSPLLALGILAVATLRFEDRNLRRLAALPWLVTTVIALPLLTAVIQAGAHSITFDPLPFSRLPDPVAMLLRIGLPSIAIFVAAWLQPRLFDFTRQAILSVQTAIGILAIYVLMKQPFSIANASDFIRAGFVERAIITDAALAFGCYSIRVGRFRPLGHTLVALAIGRVLWFDAIGLNPVSVPQEVGNIPVLNAATLHLVVAALLVWKFSDHRAGRWIGAVFTLAAALITVRQLAHGTLLTGPVSVAENWGYSAAMLGLAAVWLWRGLITGIAHLRIFGLSLLAATTLKVFLLDAAALSGLLRILSFMALGMALIAIGWAYRRFLDPHVTEVGNALPADRVPKLAPTCPIE